MRYKVKLKTINLTLAEATSDYQGEEVSGETKAVDILMGIYRNLDADQEHFCALFLNRRNAITGFKVLHSGGQVASIVDAKTLFRNALLFGATGLIIAHNHPSGNLKLSNDDLVKTKELVSAGKMLGIEILDHIILTDYEFFSFKKEGLL